jgi:four helix bundle protein
MGLEFVGWVYSQPAGATLSTRLFRQLDKLATSVVLNMAEGNGRYGVADRRQFIDLAEAAAVKSAAYVDLCWRSGDLAADQRSQGIELLGSIVRMLNSLSAP